MSPWLYRSHTISDVHLDPTYSDAASDNHINGATDYVKKIYSPLRLVGSRNEKISLCFLAKNIIQVRVIPPSVTRIEPSFIVCGPNGDFHERKNAMDYVGRDRDDLSLFSVPTMDVITSHQVNRVCVSMENGLQVSFPTKGVWSLQWSYLLENHERIEFARDGKTRGVCYEEIPNDLGLIDGNVLAKYPERNYASGGVMHYMTLDMEKEHIYGLGETPGSFDLTRRFHRLKTSDSMGYNAQLSETSLYKHFPFFIVSKKVTLREGEIKHIYYGMLYDDLCRSEFDFGNEISAFHGVNRHFKTETCALDYYMIFGSSIKEVVYSLGKYLIGRPKLPPIWSLGYLASAMIYSDAEDAQEQLENFPVLCKKKTSDPLLRILSLQRIYNG